MNAARGLVAARRALTLAVSLLGGIAAAASAAPTILGPSKCTSCHDHDKQAAWAAKDTHTKGLTQLDDPKAAGYAKAIGLADPYDLKGTCVRCHATVFNGDANAGVSCETCHGPGSDYVQPHQEKGTHARSITLGLYDTRDQPSVWAKMCVDCHVMKDAKLIAAGHKSGADFDVGVSSQKIVHWVPPYDFAKLSALGKAAAPAAGRPAAAAAPAPPKAEAPKPPAAPAAPAPAPTRAAAPPEPKPTAKPAAEPRPAAAPPPPPTSAPPPPPPPAGAPASKAEPAPPPAAPTAPAPASAAAPAAPAKATTPPVVIEIVASPIPTRVPTSPAAPRDTQAAPAPPGAPAAVAPAPAPPSPPTRKPTAKRKPTSRPTLAAPAATAAPPTPAPTRTPTKRPAPALPPQRAPN